MSIVNKKGSMTLVFILAVMVFAVSATAITMSTTTLSNINRHRKQLENVYTYASFSEMVASEVLGQLDNYTVTSPRTMMQDIEHYRIMSQELGGKFTNGSNEYVLMDPIVLLRTSLPSNGETAKFIQEKIEESRFSVKIHVEDMFVPDFTLVDTQLEFKNGDYFYFMPIRVQVEISNRSSSVTKEFTFKNIRCDIAMSDSTITIVPDLSKVVIQTSYSSVE